MIAACNGKDTDFIQIDPKEAELKGLDVFWFKKKPFIRLSSYETRAFSAKLLKDNQLIDTSDARKIAVLNDKGDFIHPKRDLHWELSETAFERPRETMEDEQERKSGKVGNFSIPYLSVELKKVNCWKPLRALTTTTYLETESVNVQKC